MAINILTSQQEKLSFIHKRLHPLTKMIVTLLVLLMTGLWLDVRYLLPVFIFGLILSFWARVPKAWFIVMVVALLMTWYPTMLTTISQAKSEYYQVLDQQWAATKVLTFDTNILGLGTMGLTYGSLYWLAGRLARFAAVVTWAMTFVATTPVNEISNTLYALKVPYQIVFVLQITYKFIPYMFSVISQISDAQRLRGWNLRTINPVKLFKRAVPMANPLVRRTLMIVEQVTIATQIRGFGSGQVTPMRGLTLSRLDKVIIGVTVVLFVAAVLALIFLKAGQI